MEKTTLYKLYNPSAKLKRQLGLDKWKKAKGEEGVFALTLLEKNRCSNKLYAPRLVFDTRNKILEVYYPHFSTGAEIAVRHTRIAVGKELKSLLKAKKYLTVVTRDYASKHKTSDKYNYTIDYYAEIDAAPNEDMIKEICKICENPILEY